MVFDRRVRAAYIVTMVTLVVGGLGLRATVNYLGYYLEKAPVPLRKDLSTIPATLGEWKRYGEDRIEPEDVLHELGTNLYVTRDYVRGGDPKLGVIQVHIAYYTGMIDAMPHIPERCMYAAGLVPLAAPQDLVLDIKYEPDPLIGGGTNRATELPYAYKMVEEPVTRQMLRVAMPVGEMAIKLTRFQNPKERNMEVDVGYFFVANGGATPNTWGVQRLAFNLTDQHAYYCKVQLAMKYPIGDASAVELFRKDASEFLTLLMPQLMRALPDWPAIEAAEMAEKAKK